MRTIERSPAWLDSLNPQQREAVTHGDGPLLVVAGAGSGKTRTLAYRVAHLVAQGVPPERVLLLTFTRRAAGAMLERAALAVRGGEAIARRAWGGTFHAIGNRLLRIHGRAAGLEPDFTIIDHSDAEDLMDILRHQLGLSKTGGRFPRKGTCLAIYSRRVNGGDDLTTVLRKHFPWCAQWEGELRSLFRAYAERKLEQRVLDYDDLLLYWYHLSQDGPLGDLIGGGFDHILVDEYQDTNVLQAGILAGMRRELRNITVVGDDAQSIYGFRSATPRNMLDFPAQFPGATTVLLEQSYRSTPPILETANRVIGQARERYSKRLWSARTGGQQP
ncbi:MAG: ATP-dependent helicase, partial [Candidatus Brocadiia bacterium]|nr:ATP-dependent helicase [Candidatus Brocadiia bacterium]